MTTDLRLHNQAREVYVRALTTAWANAVQLFEPSVWLARDPEAEEKMLRDPDIAHAVGFRRHLIAGRQWELVPSVPGSPRADLAVAVGTELLRKIRGFTGARYNLSRAFFSGARFARIHGDLRTLRIGDGKPRTWWLPVRLEDIDKRRMRIVPTHDRKDGTQKLGAKWQVWDVANAEWRDLLGADAMHMVRHVYQDDEGSLGYGRALREALGWTWYTKTHVMQESVQAVERFAQGIVHAKVEGSRDADSGKPNTEVVREWTRLLENLRSRHVLVSDKADEIEVISPSGEGHQILTTMRAELRSAVFTLVLGANLTTAASEGGSYALGEIQENSTEALVQFDRETLEESLTDDLIGCCWWRNHANLVDLGIVEEAPRFNIKQEKKLDPEVRARVASTLNGMGVDIASDDLYEQTGFRKPQQGEEVIAGRIAPDPTALPGGGALPFAR